MKQHKERGHKEVMTHETSEPALAILAPKPTILPADMLTIKNVEVIPATVAMAGASTVAAEPAPEPSRPTPEEMLAKLKAMGRSRVAIVGFTPSRADAPYQNSDYEIWALNDLFEAIPRCDRLFQIHSRQSIDTYTTRGERATYIERLRELPVPIYMIEKQKDIPNSVAYPLSEIIAEFGNYFTNSISFMIALAIHEGFEEIHIYGVDMAVGAEYIAQRPSCEHIIGWAQGKGIRVFIPHQSDLLKSRFLYGFQEDEENAFNRKCDASVKMMGERLQGAQNQEIAVHDAAMKYEGGIQVLAGVIAQCADEATLAKLKNTQAQMVKDRDTRFEQIKQIHEIVNKYQGAIQAIGEIGKTWATCLTHPDPMDIVTGEGCLR